MSGKPILDDGQPASPSLRLDPNIAPWWELVALPEIGEVIARRIVEHRESFRSARPGDDPRRPFATPEDLLNVRGIGPKTLDRIRPFLRFDSRPSG